LTFAVYNNDFLRVAKYIKSDKQLGLTSGNFVAYIVCLFVCFIVCLCIFRCVCYIVRRHHVLFVKVDIDLRHKPYYVACFHCRFCILYRLHIFVTAIVVCLIEQKKICLEYLSRLNHHTGHVAMSVDEQTTTRWRTVALTFCAIWRKVTITIQLNHTLFCELKHAD